MFFRPFSTPVLRLLAFNRVASTASVLRCRRSLCVYNPPTPAGVWRCKQDKPASCQHGGLSSPPSASHPKESKCNTKKFFFGINFWHHFRHIFLSTFFDFCIDLGSHFGFIWASFLYHFFKHHFWHRFLGFFRLFGPL